MKKFDMIPDLIKTWGVQKFLDVVVKALRKMGKNENQLASDVDIALKRYVDRQ